MQSTLAVISLGKIRSNALKIRRAAGVPMIAVVKDDAYGHGAERVAHAIEDVASAYAVSTADEGAALRIAGISKEILCFTPPLDEEDVLRAAHYGLTLSATSLAALRLILRASEKYGRAPLLHIAINTGMNRYGFRPERVNSAVREATLAGLSVTGVYSHLYLPENGDAVREQRALFEQASFAVREAYPDAVRHLSATGGALAGEGFDAVRAGISLYGYLPAGFTGKLPVQPAAKIYARVSHVCTQIGKGVGYARTEKKYGKLHTLRLGYGDGFFREGGVGAVGKLCMDACVREGMGRTGETRLVLKNVSAYAKEHGTTEYEALVHILRKAEKRYG